ncbi:AP endonuclease, partial [Thioclava sp. BHET1]
MNVMPAPEITVTCAPCCWGVDDVANPHLPPWERVLEEA